MAEDYSPEAILEQALELSDLEERAAYLDKACRDNETLRGEIESLLAAHFAADAAFMDTLADSSWQGTPSEKEGAPSSLPSPHCSAAASRSAVAGRNWCHKVGQFMRRNRAAVVVAATITFLLVAGIAGISWFAKQAAENLKHSQLAQEKKQEAKEKENEAKGKKREAKQPEREARKPAADQLMEEAHFAMTLRQLDLTGTIRKGETKFRVGLFRRGTDIQLSYNQPETKKAIRFHVRHGKVRTAGLDLFEIVDGETLRFPDEKLGQAIAGTDLSYEDLAMSFLYWPKAILEGSKKTKGQDCWVVRAVNPGKAGAYRQVRVWIHKKTHTLMQVVGYNVQGRPLKRMLVTDIMKVGEGRIIDLLAGNADDYASRRIRFDSIDPVANKVVGITYLEFDKPKSTGPGDVH